MTDQAHTPEEAARRLGWRGPAHGGDWTPVERRFRDGHIQTWYAADLTFSGYGPERLVRLVVATTDPAALPAIKHLVSDHQSPLSSFASSGRLAACSGRPGGDRAPVRITQLGRAGVQAGEAGTGLGRLHGAQRSCDPPPLAPGLLCLLV